MTILVKKVFISSKPTFVYLLCPPLCGLFSFNGSPKIEPFQFKRAPQAVFPIKQKKGRAFVAPALPFTFCRSRQKFLCIHLHRNNESDIRRMLDPPQRVK